MTLTHYVSYIVTNNSSTFFFGHTDVRLPLGFTVSSLQELKKQLSTELAKIKERPIAPNNITILSVIRYDP